MCVNKLYLRNNKLDFNPIYDRYYNYVPCGKCEECLRARSLQYEVRSIAEFEYVKSIGGCSYYYTLTYNDTNVPKFENVNVFSKTDIQLFHKRLRKAINKDFPGIKITWFLSSEYGHKTLRPHYHVIYYLHSFISPRLFYNYILKTWQKGFICPGSNLGLIKDNRPFRYVSKYIQKDLYSFDLLNGKGFTKSQLLDYKKNKKVKFKDVDLLPFHLQSVSFGLSLLNSISYIDFVKGYFVKTDSLGVSRKVPVPLYIIRKKFYEPFINSNGNISYILTHEGLLFLKDKLLMLRSDILEKTKLLALSVHSYYYKLTILSKNFKNECLCKKFFEDFIKNDLEDYVNFNLLYSLSEYCPFRYHDFLEDLDIYVNFMSSFVDNDFYPNNFNSLFQRFDFIRQIFDKVQLLKNYDSYILNCNKYNARQTILSQRTGKYKSCYIKRLPQFVNLNTNNLCLTILTKRKIA